MKRPTSTIWQHVWFDRARYATLLSHCLSTLMKSSNPFSIKRLLALAAICLLFCLPSLAMAQGQVLTAADRAEIASFTLTTDVITRLQGVTTDGQAMHTKHAALDMSQVHSLDDMANQMAAVDPRITPLLAKHGFTPHQFVVANLALVNAVTAANAANNPGMAGQGDRSTFNPANVVFYEAHRDAINALMQQAGGG